MCVRYVNARGEACTANVILQNFVIAVRRGVTFMQNYWGVVSTDNNWTLTIDAFYM